MRTIDKKEAFSDLWPEKTVYHTAKGINSGRGYYTA